MNVIDILIFIVCTGGLFYFAFKRIKYSNRNVYRQKYERLNILNELISAAETEKEEAENLISSVNFDDEFKDGIVNKFIKYGDNMEKLRELKKEQTEIERYLRNAGRYINNS